MNLLQTASWNLLRLWVVMTIGVLAGSGGAVSAQCHHTSANWKLDEIGYAYQEAFVDGRWQRVYQQPRRQAVAWEVSRHLPKIGLPATHSFRRASGVDAFGRRWSRDALGYAYYETGCGGCVGRTYYQAQRQSIAAAVHRQFTCVDWEASVRQGVVGAVTRGFNAVGVPAIDDETLSSVVGEQIVEGLNRAAADAGSGNLSRFQDLVAEGVEDAIVQAFNQMDLMRNEGRAVTPRARSEKPTGETSVLADRSDGDRAPARVPVDVRSAPADEGHAHLVKMHYGGGLDPTAFHERYGEARFVDGGWIIDKSGSRPVIGAGMLILTLQTDGHRVEAWRDGILVFSDCQYSEYFEHAQEIAARFPRE